MVCNYITVFIEMQVSLVEIVVNLVPEHAGTLVTASFVVCKAHNISLVKGRY